MSKREYISTVLFYFSVIIFVISFNFSDNPPPSGWYQQWMPNLSGMPVADIFFIDSLNGFAGTNGTSDSNYVLKTTNGGDNWLMKFKDRKFFNEFYFLNLNTGYVCGTKLLKTTNSGDNWFIVNSPFGQRVADMHVLNEDTIWFVDPHELDGGVFRTTNGGLNWTVQYRQFSNNPTHIYMYNARIGFMDGGGLKKTTNGGVNWFPVSGGNFLDMYFIDSLTGWKCNLDLKKTTDGGLNWVSQVIPSGGNIVDNSVLRISKISSDTIWGYGGTLIVGGSPPTRGILYRTVNGGNNWLFQLPDTSIHINKYFHGQFINNRIGWGYHVNPTGIHTKVGGDTTFYTGIKRISNNIPTEYILGQNYPNPFNSTSIIEYRISKSVFVQLKVYDVTGRLVSSLISQQQIPGEYHVNFDGSNYSSGIYFYSLIIDGETIDTKKMILIR